MSERDAFLRAICENPDDDTPRLVFADWLQENGEEDRAEFIRLQIQLARGNYRPSEEARLKRRLKKLNSHTPQWALEVPGAESVQFFRGIVERARFRSVPDFERAIGVAPLRYVIIYGPVDLVAVMNLVHVQLVGCLDLERATIREADIETFAAHHWPHHPERLMLPFDGMRAALRNRVLSLFHDWVWVRPS